MSEQLLEKLLQSKKYQDICPDTIRRIWGECLLKYKKPKDVEKAAREQLHGITGAFLSREEAVRCYYDLMQWIIDRHQDKYLHRALERHASTRERLPLERMDAMYARIFETTGRPASILDLACGLNPIYLGARGISAEGIDISGQATETIRVFSEMAKLPVHAVCADLLCENTIPRKRFDVCLLFKILPLLERQRNGAAMATLRQINAAHIVVSFPTRTLGGRNVGMEENYSRWMEEHLPESREIADRFTAENELFYILKEK